ncbi:uncharacterized protein LOC116201366 [Punica granatum]|uniref:DC1 domain-containing protein n=2 Tax=Punica granatum TaxID=22663 RepID=A0A218WIP9_PUNGR|nr:uncharacterized protein LOC116201366 [Punica granatum]OWM72433.1 hypothetical protein CDL15_Pgr018318 [Punica granatum]PKI76145.1 hypothetical protein CRG98_003506 [Punica granatum]
MEAESSNLRRQIDHPAHTHSGPLTLTLTLTLGRGSQDSSCSICGKRFKQQDPVYSCSDPHCDFKVDLACSSIRSVIEFEAHRQHPLCFVERVAPGTSCRHCTDKRSDLPMFRCGECGFSLHLLCGPLPRVIQYKHFELTLTDSLLNGVDADDCWCDICERQRDPAQCVYHSRDSMVTASIDCLLPQIILALKGDLGELELRTVGEHIPGKVIIRVQVEDCLQPPKVESEIYGDEMVEEAESSSETCSPEAEEETEFSPEMEEDIKNFFSDLQEELGPVFAEASKQWRELIDSFELYEEAKPKKGKSKIQGDEWAEEAETSTVMEEVFRGLSLDSHQLLRSLNADQADDFEGFLNATAKFIGQSKATGSFPFLDDAAQRFKEQLDISSLEEDVQHEKPESGTEDDEVVEGLTLTYVQVMRSLTPQDIEQINSAFRKCTKHGKEGEAIVSFLYYSSAPPPPPELEFPYSDHVYERFKEQIDNTDRVNDSYLTGWKKYAAKIVKVGNNMIPSQFVPIYRELVDRYGDFSADSELSPVAKAVIFHLFFAVVYSMRGTQVRNITDDLLCTWQYYLRGVQNAGFKIQFAIDNLEKLLRARCGLKVMEFRDDTGKNLEVRVEELSKQIDEKEAKLEALKSIREKYRKPREAEETLVKQCLIEAANWKWKDVGDLIL